MRRGVSGLYFPDELGDVWKFLQKTLDEEGRVPEADEVEDRFSVRLARDVNSFDADSVADLISAGLATTLFDEGMKGSKEACKKGDLDSALSLAEAQIRRARNLHYGGISASHLYGQVGEVEMLYERAKRGDIGVPFPWPTMNSSTMGMWEKTLTLFVARPGVGKTMSSLVVANHVRSKTTVDILYVSPEMFKWEIAERNLAMEAKVNYGRLIQGHLRTEEEERFRARVREQKEWKPDPSDTTCSGLFWIVDRSDIIGAKDDLLALETLIEEYRSRAALRGRKLLLIVDALYKLGSGRDRTEQMVVNILWAVRMGIQYDCPVLATTQFNRGAGAGGMEASLENLGLTDVAAWEAHQIFALFRDKDMKANRQMGFKPLKVRRLASDGTNEFRVHWDFDTMSFGEIATEGKYVDTDYATTSDDVKY
jgi:hypothetical protein